MLGMAIRKWCVRLIEDMRPPRILAQREAFSDFHHLKIVLAGTALGAGPVHRHIFPARAGLDSLVGKPRRLVVDEAADEAHPGLELNLVLGHWRPSRIGA